ncbi:PQQ-dependent sugar dehydrogenase [Marinobacter sp. F3R11]|uniref:PQQ-dependent sugar dehydrogenase n=1 Tax=Marinobacter sp. F3R11 TaxID=2267231 RepID=UPI000DE93874|nr:PQQ-dependent sugar dehydrogenase [Marinobacter sp. F3R11]RBW50697.1 PQQ-dependent sugar dehydrogenase [Marinobacter sp. F3R11]
MLPLPGLSLAAETQTFSSGTGQFKLQTVADNLEHPWSLAFLPDGSILVTERAGRLRVIQNGNLLPQAVPGLPSLAVSGQGGLFDVVLHPDFEENRTLFLSYAHSSSEGMTTRVARASFENGQLKNVNTIFEALPRSRTSRHFGGRMAFDTSGYLYISVGDRGDMDRAQDTKDDAGGVHRITVDGKPAPGNPGLDDPNINNTLFTWGNRNIQGMVLHPTTGDIWTHEHGPRGGDEINILEAGTNYGWPVITYGIDYSGLPISLKTEMKGMAQPLHYWDPSIAPSGMAFYTGSDFSEWQDNLFVGALKLRKLVRMAITNGQVTEEEDLLTGLGERIRDVRVGPGGNLWLLTDSPRGRVYQVVPVQ